MRALTLIAALSVLSVPAAAAAEAPKGEADDYRTKKICKIERPIGSRLGGVKRCRTRAEEAEYKAQARQQMDKIITSGNMRCRPAHWGGACE
jgi:hypothetical protein